MALLDQVLMAQTPIQQFVPWIGLITLIYLLYKVFGEKDAKFIELLGTQKLLIPIFILIALALVPASTTVLFGIAEPLIDVLLQIIIAILMGVAVSAGIVFVAKLFGWKP